MDSFSSMPSFNMESQPSQILKEVLRGAVDLPIGTAFIEHNSWADDDSHTSTSKTAPQYHYHGLASTQSQFDDSHIAESSQKENTPASPETSNVLTSNQPHLAPPPSKNTSKVIDGSRAAYVPDTPPTPCIPQATEAVSFISPRLAPSSPPTNLRQSRSLQPSSLCQRSPSPASQDSFAGPPFRKDPEQEFLAVSKQFGIPLSELGTSPEDRMLPGKTVASSTKVHDASILVDRSQSSNESHSQESDVAIDPGTTDSQRIDSQSQGQYDVNYDDYIVNNHNRDPFIERNSQFDVQFDNSPQPSSFSEGIYTEVPTQLVEESIQIVEESTQPVEEPTQIIGNQLQAAQPIEGGLAQTAFSPIPLSANVPIPATSNTSTNPRSLHHMIDPNKRWRYNILPSVIHPVAVTTQAETQPNLHETAASKITIPPPSPPQPRFTAKEDDNMDVVPDSEPPRAETTSSERRASPPQLELSIVLESEHETCPGLVEEGRPPPPASLTPLSDDDDNDDDDRPLVTFMSRPSGKSSQRGKRRAVYTEDSDSGSDQPLATRNLANESRKPSLPPPSKKRKLNAPTASGPKATGSRKAQIPVAALTKAKAKKSAPKGKGTGNVSESTTNRKRTPSIEEDTKTEPAVEEDYMDMSFVPDDVGPSRKRKKTGSTAKKVPSSRSATTTSITPSTRSTLLRAAPGSLKGAGIDATRVFARWPLSGYYYSGYTHARSSAHNTRYIVKFDDDTECDADVDNLRKCEFVIGDKVYLLSHKQNGEVVAINRWEREGKVRVEMDGGIEVDVEASVIRVSENVIKEQWSKRAVHTNSIVPFLQAVSLKSSPSKSLFVGGTSSAKFLRHFGFVVTLNSGNDNWVNTRDGLVKMIEGKGGTVMGDWSSIFELNANHNGKRWRASQGQMVYNKSGEQDDIRSVFLLADEPNQKPKYLIALALGIPCVSIDWLKHSVADHSLLDWTLYLLPAGQCASLDALASQRINMRWGDKTQEMVDMWSNSLASKLFQGKSVICVGDGMFPARKSFKRNNSAELNDKRKQATRTVPEILLAMGAELVEAVLDPKHASTKLNEFDYVLVEEPDDVEKYAEDGVTCVHLPWVKECLIASKLLPLPDETD